jgi:hypothetical protein
MSVTGLNGDRVASSPLPCWGDEFAERHARCLLSNELIDRLSLCGDRVQLAPPSLQAAGNRDR